LFNDIVGGAMTEVTPFWMRDTLKAERDVGNNGLLREITSLSAK
jgi:hypothetical protein